jgi:signal transduction histidine kinase
VAESDALRVGDRVYSLNARQLPAEDAVLAVVRDRTEEMRREVAEREFVSNAAHELRNPIAGISGAIEVLRAGAKDDPEAREHFLVRLSEDAERISRLTESLLTLARMEAVGEGGTEALDVGLVVEEAAEAVAAPDGIEVALEVGSDIVGQGDRVLLRQVLIGLLTNAFKNTPAPGRVTITARRGRAEGLEGEGEVWIEVADTGSGIGSAEIDRIFERFYRGSGSLEQEGFGLGLSIARRMVDVMGGEIGVESVEGEGSTFWVRLRAAQPATTPVA